MQLWKESLPKSMPSFLPAPVPTQMLPCNLLNIPLYLLVCKIKLRTSEFYIYFFFLWSFLVPFYHLTVCISFRAFPTPYVSEFLAVTPSSYDLFLWKLPVFFQNLKSDNCGFQAILKDTETKNANIPVGTKFK